LSPIAVEIQFSNPGAFRKVNSLQIALEEKRKIAARFYSEHATFNATVEQFCKGEPHNRYLAEQNKILKAIMTLVKRSCSDQGYDLFANAHATHRTVLDALCSIPTPIDSTIHDAVSPFST